MDGVADEGALIRRIKSGETNLYEELVEKYKNYVFAIVHKHVPAEAVAEVAHVTFVDGFKGVLKPGEIKSFKSWIATLAVRRSYDYWRREKRKRKEVPVSALSETQTSSMNKVLASDAAEAYESENQGADARKLLNSVLNRLSAEDRMVVVLMYLEERSVDEAATALGWSVTNTKVRAFRARRKLAQLLKSYE